MSCNFVGFFLYQTQVWHNWRVKHNFSLFKALKSLLQVVDDVLLCRYERIIEDQRRCLRLAQDNLLELHQRLIRHMNQPHL